MKGFSVKFTNPWLLFLLIPAAALTVFLYLRLDRRFRRTRNRILSVVLHSLVSLLCVFVLSGMTFHYTVGNSENELILLVDVSDTTQETSARRDDFVRSVLEESAYEGCRVGIVTFGFTQETAVPFTYDAGGAYELYLNAATPDGSATDIAAALQFAQTLFEHPQTGKIVLISDGKQTDEEAMSVIRSIAAKGSTVDTVYLPGDYSDDVVQIAGIVLPEYNVKAGEDCAIEVLVESREAVEGITLSLYDNGTVAEGNSVSVDLKTGAQSVTFNHVFREQGLHELHAVFEAQDERLQQNNEFYAYRWLQVYNKVLILEQQEGQSVRLAELLEEDDDIAYEVNVVNIKKGEGIPASVDDLRAYDQVILNNISSRDLEPLELDTMLYSYVNEYGGGVFTTGGKETDGETAHAYNRADMNNTTYQQMLPVQAINYTPPVGVFIVIDISGSMLNSGVNGRTNLEWAKQGAIECLNALTDRDYVGIMTMDTEYGMVLDLTPRTQDALIREKIMTIGEGNQTIFSTAIDRSAQRLASLKNVDKRHIILVTDGGVSDGDERSTFDNAADAYNNHNITLSVVGIGLQEGSTTANTMTELVTVGHGRLHYVSRGDQLLEEMREELNAPEIEEIKYGDFNPTISNALSPLLNGVEHGTDLNDKHTMAAQLGGFFGVKARPRADVVLVGEYDVPIYAQWKFGEGMVGSFMCDVYGDWSEAFLANENGRRFLLNVVSNLMPTADIRPSSVTLALRKDNYINQLSVYSSLGEGETLEGSISCKTASGVVTQSLNALSETQEGDFYVTVALGSDNHYSRASFVAKRGGIYTITVNRLDAAGNIAETVTLYDAFSYSEEYDLSVEQDPSPETLMAELAARGNGERVAEDEPWEVFSTFVSDLDRVFDPRWLFIGLAMALFLLDITVRKFRFKWLHEIVREHKQKKAGKQ